MTRISSSELDRDIYQALTVALNVDIAARGRVLPAIVFRDDTAGHAAQVMLDNDHPPKATLIGEDPEAFHINWTVVMSGPRKPPDPDSAHQSHYRQVQIFKPIAEDMSPYNRAKWDKSLAAYQSIGLLCDASNRYLLMKFWEGVMQAALSRGLSWPADKAAPGPDLKATCDQNCITLVPPGDSMGHHPWEGQRRGGDL